MQPAGALRGAFVSGVHHVGHVGSVVADRIAPLPMPPRVRSLSQTGESWGQLALCRPRSGRLRLGSHATTVVCVPQPEVPQPVSLKFSHQRREAFGNSVQQSLVDSCGKPRRLHSFVIARGLPRQIPCFPCRNPLCPCFVHIEGCATSCAPF